MKFLRQSTIFMQSFSYVMSNANYECCRVNRATTKIVYLCNYAS